MCPSSLARRFILLFFAAVAVSHAGIGFAGLTTVDLSTSIEQVVNGPVQAGQTFQLNWEIANDASNTASNALGTLLFDARSQFIEASCPSTFESGSLTWTLPSVALAAPRQCVVTLRSEDGLSAVLLFTASVEPSPNDTDINEINNTALLQVVVEQGTNAVDLAVSLEQVVAGPVSSGADFELLWVVANHRAGGVSSAAETLLQLPPQVQFVGTSCPSVFDAGLLIWTPPSVDNAAPRLCVVRLRDGNESAPLVFETEVLASMQDTDSNPANNSARLEVAVERGVVAVHPLPAGGWPTGMALIAGLIACAAFGRRRFGFLSRRSRAT